MRITSKLIKEGYKVIVVKKNKAGDIEKVINDGKEFTDMKDAIAEKRSLIDKITNDNTEVYIDTL